MKKVRRKLVNVVTGVRVACGAVLLGAIPLHWWALAAGVLALGIVTDLIDGRLARRWRTESAAGRHLHYNATVFLAVGGTIGAVFGGVWVGWLFPAVAFGYVLDNMLRRRLRGVAQRVRKVVSPVAHCLLLGALMTTLVIQAR